MASFSTLHTTDLKCYHCGESCVDNTLHYDNKNFCCEGCKLVYDLLKENNLCTYYNLNGTPGISPEKNIYAQKFDYLNYQQVEAKLVRFSDGNEKHITFFVPSIHCSSCIWLLENMHRLNKAISNSAVNFLRKEVSIIYDSQQIKLSEIAALLAHIGYEPLINIDNTEQPIKKATHKSRIVKIGIAGFCFGNIMMLSFPEYFSLGGFHVQTPLQSLFGYVNLLLSLPVFFYCASEFFVSAYKSIRYRYLNIDTPIALAIAVTFGRSVYEILTTSGAGYMDSMSGIVFFMLIGRYFQNKTYDTLSFERDYKSYFPLGVTIKNANGEEKNIPVSELKKGNTIIIRNNELLPADAILLSTDTLVDYSFITGESAPVKKVAGELIYAGAKQLTGAVELNVVNTTSQSYLTQLWNKDDTKQQQIQSKSYIDTINTYFTAIVLSIAFLSAAYWLFNDVSKALNAFTAVLIVACPCGLLLTATFANGNITRIFGRNKLYIKNAAVIEKLTKATTIVFDKTGTITHGSTTTFIPITNLDEYTVQLVASLASQSSHPLSKAISALYPGAKKLPVTNFEEFTGLGTKAIIDGKNVLLGSKFFVSGNNSLEEQKTTNVFLMIDSHILGYYSFTNNYRKGINELMQQLSKHYNLKLLSGDNTSEKEKLQTIFGTKTELHFNQTPSQKRDFIRKLQQQNHKVIMVGDGLNDAGALKQSDIGIAITDDTNNFSPACDAILDGSQLNKLNTFITSAKAGKKVIIATFVVSLVYNIIGLTFAVQSLLSPVIAAILMPASSISIVLLTTLLTTLIAKTKRL